MISIDKEKVKQRFELTNLFNAKAITIGLMATAGVLSLTLGITIIDAFSHWHNASPNTPFILAGGAIASGLTGVWNAHAVGGQTTMGKSKGATVARNLFFMSMTSLAPALGLAYLTAGLTPLIGGVAGLALGAGLNAKWLKWEPSNVETPSSEQDVVSPETPAQAPKTLKTATRVKLQKP